MTTEQQEPRAIPSLQEFCLNVPLYDSYSFDSTQEQNVRQILAAKGDKIDCYCMECGQPSVFECDESPVAGMFAAGDYPERAIRDFELVFHCARDDEHRLIFYFRIHEGTISKVGQYPSLADLSTVDIKKYRKVLGNERYAEFNRGVGLISHGVGIGSFVYLRRILEHLVEEAHQVERTAEEWDEKKYTNSHMGERISLLKNILPKFLVENKVLHAILSKGIHELSDEECLLAFQTTRVGIELILDEHLERMQREEKIKKSSGDLQDLNTKLARRKAG